MLRQLEAPESPLWRPAAQRLVEAAMLDLFDVLDDCGDGAARLPGDSRVRQAEALMHARSDWPLTMEEVAREVGIGSRALQAAFRSHRGTTPRAMLAGFRM